MKAVADTLAVARSNLIERVSRRAKSRRPYRKGGDDELLALIRRLVDERPTYGYRRIRRLINRQRDRPIDSGRHAWCICRLQMAKGYQIRARPRSASVIFTPENEHSAFAKAYKSYGGKSP
jgi:hypothetical protein